MPRKREDDEQEEDFDGLSEETHDDVEVTKTTNESEESTVAILTAPDRTNSRSLEWSFFDDVGPWDQSGFNYRKAKCKKCATIKRSKRQTLKSHILACPRISSAARNQYQRSTFSFRNTNVPEKTQGSSSIKNFFQVKLSKAQISRIESQLVRGAIATNTALNVLSNPEYLKAFQMLNPSFQLCGKTSFRTTVFERVSKEERKKVHSVYAGGCYISLSMDGWVTPGHRKWLGVCAISKSIQNGKSTIDTRRFEDISLESENEVVVTRELKAEINDVLESIEAGSNKSILGSIITDSHKPNVAAKRKLASLFPNLLFLPCHAHQLNLFAGNILTHRTTKSIVGNAIDLINYFHSHPKQKALLQDIIQKSTGTQLEFVQYGNTRWYSHYQMILRLFKAKPHLEEYKRSIQDKDPILKKKIAAKALDTIGATSFWFKLNLISELLRVIVIEIGKSERRTANLSDVVESFGRIWAFLLNIYTYQSSRFECFPGLLNDMLVRWKWRLNIYYDVKCLVMAHVLNPRLGMRGLNQAVFNKRKVYNFLQNIADQVDPGLSKDSGKREKLARKFVLYLQQITDGEYSVSQTTDLFSYWSCQSEIEFQSATFLRKVAMFVFSVPASSAGLERIWSSCLINLTSRRRRLKKDKVLKTIQIKTDITREQELANEFNHIKAKEKHGQKATIAELLDEIDITDVQSQQSQSNAPSTFAFLGDSSSSESENDEDTEGSAVLTQIDSELQEENISEFASNLLQYTEELTDDGLEVLVISEVQAFLDGKKLLPHQRERSADYKGIVE